MNLSPRLSDAPLSVPTRRARADRLGWAVLGGSALALGLLLWWLLRGRGSIGADGWARQPHLPWPAGAWGLPLCALLLFGGLSVACLYDRFYRAKTQREGQTSLRMALGALMLLSLVWNWGLLGPYGFNAQREARVGFFMVLAASWSDVSTEYLGTAYQIESARDFSSRYALDWQRPRSAVIAHVATHPPGATLFYFACRRAVEGIPALREGLLSLAERASQLDRVRLARELNEMRQSSARSGGAPDARELPVDAIATALLASALLGAAPALAIPALFMLGSMGASALRTSASRDQDSEHLLRRSQGRGAVAAALWILAPTTGLFAPTLDALVALGAAWTLALACKYLRAPQPPSDHTDQAGSGRKYLRPSGGRGYLVGAGIVLALTGFVSFGALTIGLVLALWLGLERRARDLIWLLSGVLAAQAVLLLLFPHAWPQVFTQAMSAHRSATLSTRSYTAWLALNPLMFVLFAGWPVVLGAALALLQKPQPSGESARDLGLAHLRRLGFAVLGAMLLISIAGSVRGEVERLWMFLLPPFCALAAASWLPLEGGARRSKVALVGIVALLAIVLQAIQSLVMAATLAPLVLP